MNRYFVNSVYRHLKTGLWGLAGLLMLLICLISRAEAGVSLTARGGLGVYSISEERFLRESDGNPGSLNTNEYIAFYVSLTNSSGKTQRCTDPCFRVDGGEKLRLKTFNMENGQKSRCHVFHVNMVKIGPGSHQVDFYAGGSCIFSQTFRLLRDWRALMPYPSRAGIKAAGGKSRSPYIVFYPQFEGTDGITEYAIDFQIDDMDNGTYFCAIDANLDISALESRYDSVYNDYSTAGSFYCGVQKWKDGRTGVIMSVWDNICRKNNGMVTIVTADQIYPEFREGKSSTSGEGRFQQFIQEYQFRTGTPYRILIQLVRAGTGGNSELSMYICDLDANRWDRLVSWDLCYQSRFIRTGSLAGFMENYLKQYAGSVRNVSFSDIRGRNRKNSKWIAAKKVKFTVNNSITELDYRGSYNFGSDASAFWIITSGVEGLCRLPKSGTFFTVKNAATSSPY